MKLLTPRLFHVLLAASVTLSVAAADANLGVGAKPVTGAEVILDGSREMLDAKWTYWQGPRFASSLPIKWKIVEDPVDKGKTVVQTDDPVAAGGKYGTADIVTKKPYRDFRLHIEFCVMNPRGNSGVYLQNRYEIQIMEGDKTKHGMGAVINETESPYHAFAGLGKWNSYDIVFRAARFKDGQRVEKAMVTMYFNGQKVHKNVEINQVWGGANSGVDGGNDKGKGIWTAATTRARASPTRRRASSSSARATTCVTATLGSRSSISRKRARISDLERAAASIAQPGNDRAAYLGWPSHCSPHRLHEPPPGRVAQTYGRRDHRRWATFSHRHARRHLDGFARL